jgi:hypothetical protein
MNKIRNLFSKSIKKQQNEYYNNEYYNFKCSLGDKYIKLGKITNILSEIDISISKITNILDPIIQEYKLYSEFIGEHIYNNFKEKYDLCKKIKYTQFDLIEFIKIYDLFLRYIEPIDVLFQKYNVINHLEDLKIHIQRYHYFNIIRKKLIQNIEETNEFFKPKKPNQEINSQENTNNINNDERLCAICLKNNRNCVFVHPNNTAHLITCYECGNIIKKDNNTCPICRENIISINIVYVS